MESEPAELIRRFVAERDFESASTLDAYELLLSLRSQGWAVAGLQREGSDARLIADWLNSRVDRLDVEMLDRRLTARGASIVRLASTASDPAWDWWAEPQRYPGEEDQLWMEVHGCLAGAPTDDDLCWLGVNTIEALVDLFWPTALDELERLAIDDARIRKALSCCDFDEHVPERIRERLYRLVRAEDDVGSRPVGPESSARD